MSSDRLPVIATDAAPAQPARQIGRFKPSLLLHEDHDL